MQVASIFEWQAAKISRSPAAEVYVTGLHLHRAQLAVARCRNAGHVDMSSRKMQQINSFARRWSKPGLANLLEVEVAGRLSGSCPTQIPTSALLPGSSSHRSWVKQAGCEWKPATQVRSTFLQPSTQLLDELVLPGGAGRNKTRSFCSRARLRVAMCPYSCSTWVCSFKVLTSPFFTLSPSAPLLSPS